MTNIKQWENRYTAREFDSTLIPTREQIKCITDCLNYMPIQATSSNNLQLPNHLVFLLTPNDVELKNHLVKHVFKLPEGTEHFTALYDAPYVFLLMDLLVEDRNHFRSVELDLAPAFTSVGLTTGVILSQALEAGLDVGQFACVNPTNIEKTLEKINNRFKNEIKELTNVHAPYKLKIGDILMGIGVGYGKNSKNKTILNTLSNSSTSVKTHEGTNLKFFAGKSVVKKQPFMFINNV